MRDEPTTPNTIEMLPANRLGSWARNSVGRRFDDNCALSSRSGSGSRAQLRHQLLVDRNVPLARPGRHRHVGLRQALGVADEAGVFQRGAGGEGADALPGLHLPLVGFFRDQPVVSERSDGMDRKRRCRLAVINGLNARREQDAMSLQSLRQWTKRGRCLR